MIIGLLTPSLVFWVLVYLGRSELGLRGVFIAILVWLGLILGDSFLGPSYVFVFAEALLDIVLAFMIFGGTINTPLR